MNLQDNTRNNFQANNFFCCIGSQKSGTTWLGRVLSCHENIWVHPLKEIHYFDYKYCDKFTNEEIYTSRKRSLINYLTGLDYKSFKQSKLKYQLLHTHAKNFNDDWYINLFKDKPKKATISGELTPSYNRLPENGFQHLQKLHPNVKIIFLMREPVKRLTSALKMYVRNNNLNPELVHDRRFLKFLNHHGNIEMSDYKSTLKKIFKVFPKEQIFIGFYEDMFRSNESTNIFLKNLCEFLNVPFSEEVFKNVISNKFNSTSNYEFSPLVMNEISKIVAGQNEGVKEIIDNIPIEWST